MALAAVAAGFMAVASVLVVTRGTTPLVGSAGSLAKSLAGKGAVLAEASTSAIDPPGDPQTFVANDKLVRDARLERYFAAHMQFGGSSALGVPSGFLRAATTQTPDR
jgi:sigma-E factor negative regulatory protein RseA